MKNACLMNPAALALIVLAGCSNPNEEAKTPDAVNTEPVATEQVAIDTNEVAATATTAQFISIEDAIAAALKNTSGDVIDVELDTHDNGTQAEYEVDVIANNFKHEIKLNAISADIIEVTQKSLDTDDQAEHQALQQASVNLEQAIKTAADSVAGSTVTGAGFDLDNNQGVYEIKLMADNQEHEVKVDANSSDIISSKLD
ncbi:PepSY domain-containing protein [Psychrobacter sp. FDAARGOS_221]|uniref:PepSY domain-containing protein n=1 Tax=Psychrobacter sp. FDAARGOS_221 TaxID=1975705 RepID=UPI000BB57494|nr:PepSY domain-containing protein [Psychrobacter sp. FDAARGOS_221]PNK59689.1 hypothetical protein A6J60_001520 [Psychrobacter sp. FDAARGOS_221]